jgi:hypothetical protein
MGLRHFLAPFPKPTTVHQSGSTPVVAYLANEAKFFGILKRKRKNDNPSPLLFVPPLLTDLSYP